MSRRLRKEQEHAQHLKQEAEEEDDKLKKQQERIFAPVSWIKLTFGYRIEDLKETMFEEVLEMIKSDYVPNDITCRNLEIENDNVAMKCFLGHLMFVMKDSTSICILDEKNNDELAGVLLLSVIAKTNFDRMLGRVIYSEGEARKKDMAIKIALTRKVDIFKVYNCDTYLQYHLVCIKNEHRKKNLGYHIMRAGLMVAHSLNIKTASGIFTSFSLQQAASRLKFVTLQEVSYTNWRDKNNELVFSDPGAGNYTCALMACIVPPVRLKDSADFRAKTPAELIEVAVPRTRYEKRNYVNRQLEMAAQRNSGKN